MNAWHGMARFLAVAREKSTTVHTHTFLSDYKSSFVWAVIQSEGRRNGKHKHKACTLADVILRCVYICHGYGVFGMEWIKVLDSSDTHDIMDGRW